MAAKGNTFENDLLALIFNATAIANIADNAATSPLTALAVGLHTADPTDSGNQTSNEAAYTNYARQSVSRDTNGWTVSGSTVNPAAAIEFPQAGTTTAETITHFHVGTDASTGTGKLLYFGAVSPNIAVDDNVTPRLTTATAITED